MTNTSQDLQLAINAAKKGGTIIRKFYNKTIQTHKKQTNDFVTDVDLKVEQSIIDTLSPSGYSVLGEETGELKNNNEKKWVIDPIDGTLNFINGISFFSISIALIDKNNNVLLGVIYN